MSRYIAGIDPSSFDHGKHDLTAVVVFEICDDGIIKVLESEMYDLRKFDYFEYKKRIELLYDQLLERYKDLKILK